MANDMEKPFNDDPFKAPVPHATELVVAAGILTGDVNPKAAVNAILIEEAKDGVRYKNGVTMPMSAKRLMAAAKLRSIRPSHILSGNLSAAGEARPDGVAAHHIVAAGDKRAVPAQKRLFGWHISINDADNGLYLPRFKSSVVPSLPKAHKHSGLHTALYHLEVFARLRRVPAAFAHHAQGRESLRAIKKELIDGTFPYRREDFA
jgi:hypothetical protein